jgi:hypothetical protein
MNLPRHWNSRFDNWRARQDMPLFPNLQKVIESSGNHPGLTKWASHKVNTVLDWIRKKSGKYTIENTRVQEWVSAIVLQILINSKLKEWESRVRVLQTHINDDVWHHVDAFIQQVDEGEKRVYYWIDFTFDQRLLEEKNKNLGKINPSITIRWTTIVLPTMVVYMPQKMIKAIALSIEKLLYETIDWWWKLSDINTIIVHIRLLFWMYQNLNKQNPSPIIQTSLPDRFQPHEKLKMLSRSLGSR